MVNVIGVRFQEAGKMYYFSPGNENPAENTFVLVETSKGREIGEVVMTATEVDEAAIVAPLREIIRLADEHDLQQNQENRDAEKEAFRICQEKIEEHQLEMKLVSVEYAFDRSKILFFFTANGRVDFRSLVKDLASIFKTRIELRQIGVRDEARMLGGLGACGRPICCKAFLNDFQPVSIKMAKEQKLSLNPTKISGVCGRLMCCLKYEEDHYEETHKRMPRIGREIDTPDGRGTVVEQNAVLETLKVRFFRGDSTEIREYPLDVLVPDAEKAADHAEADHAEAAAESPIAAESITVAVNEEEIELLEETLEEAEDAGEASQGGKRRRDRNGKNAAKGKNRSRKRSRGQDRDRDKAQSLNDLEDIHDAPVPQPAAEAAPALPPAAEAAPVSTAGNWKAALERAMEKAAECS